MALSGLPLTQWSISVPILPSIEEGIPLGEQGLSQIVIKGLLSPSTLMPDLVTIEQLVIIATVTHMPYALL